MEFIAKDQSTPVICEVKEGGYFFSQEPEQPIAELHT